MMLKMMMLMRNEKKKKMKKNCKIYYVIYCVKNVIIERHQKLW